MSDLQRYRWNLFVFVETFLCWSSAEKFMCKLIETRLYLESERNTAHTGISGELRLQAL